MEMRSISAPIMILSFNRPEYLSRFLYSLKGQLGVCLDETQIFLFQDGAQSQITGRRFASDTCINECIKIFTAVFPNSNIVRSDWNLGSTLNYERAEVVAFERIGANVAYFFEDDLELGPYYIKTLNALEDITRLQTDLSYFACYGNHNLDISVQTECIDNVFLLGHNWGFGLTKHAWSLMRPYYRQYLLIVSRLDQSNRPNLAIKRLVEDWGLAFRGLGQDIIKSQICAKLGLLKVNTVACFAKYIGEEGLNFNPMTYALLKYSNTPVIQFDLYKAKYLTQHDLYHCRLDLFHYAYDPANKNEILGSNIIPEGSWLRLSSSDLARHKILRWGFGDVEPDGVWTTSDLASLETFSDLRYAMMILDFEAFSPDGRVVEVRIRTKEDSDWKSFHCDPGVDSVVGLHATPDRDGRLFVDISTPNRRRPIHGDVDNREHGIFLKRVSIINAEAAGRKGVMSQTDIFDRPIAVELEKLERHALVKRTEGLYQAEHSVGVQFLTKPGRHVVIYFCEDNHRIRTCIRYVSDVINSSPGDWEDAFVDESFFVFQGHDNPEDQRSLSWQRKKTYSYVDLLPDFYYTEANGYEDFMQNETITWAERAAKFFWRGATTGGGPLSLESLEHMPRYKLCQIGRTYEGDSDFGIYNVVQCVNDFERTSIIDKLNDENLLKGHVPLSDICSLKFLIQIDGNGNAWDLLKKLRLGCCLLIVGSVWELWHDKYLQPWIHFIPVRNDLADLAEIMDWCLANDSLCEKVSIAGRNLALDLHFCEQMQSARAMIKSHMQFQSNKMV